MFTDRGVAYTLRANDIAMTTGHGEPIQKLFAFEDNEHIVSVICHDPRCLPDPGDIPQTPPALVQGLLEGEPGQANEAPLNGYANGDTSAGLPPPPYAIAL